MKHATKYALLGIALVAAGSAAFGIGRVSAAPPDTQVLPESPKPMSSGTPAPKATQPFELTINSNTQAEVDDLRIAAFNFRDENGPSCAIQVSVRDDSSKDQKLRVHKGASFSASGKSFEVADVGDKVVRLTVK